jgi:hypothetical protein
MRHAGLLVGLVVAGAVAVGASAAASGPNPALVTAGAGLLATGIAGLAVAALDAAAERWGATAPLVRDSGLSKADRLVVARGARAGVVRVAVVRSVFDPLRVDGAALVALAVLAVGVAVGYRTADELLDGLRHGLLACGLGGALCVSLAAYDASSTLPVERFGAVVAGSGVVLPVTFGLFGGVSGAVGWWLADRLASADPLA